MLFIINTAGNYSDLKLIVETINNVDKLWKIKDL